MSTERKRQTLGGPANPWKLASLARATLILATTFLPVILLWGCAGVVSGQSSQPQTPPPSQTYTISGAIAPAAYGNGTTITLSGTSSATTTANSSGVFSFAGLADGTYTLTPSKAGYTFAPTSLSVTVSGNNITAGLNFTAAANPTFNISGTVSPTAGGSGATLTLSGAATTTTTANSAGNYTFSGLANGRYAVTPSKAGYTFSPTSQAATVNGANITGLNFTATAQTNPTYSISGTISPTAGGAGAAVILSGAAGATATTNGAGNYTFSGLANGSYTVTPNNSGYTFSPVSRSVTVSAANVTGMNFTATAQQTHSVLLMWNASTSTVAGYNIYRSTVSGTGYTRINSSLVPSMAYTDSTVANGTTYYYVTTAVDTSGDESGYSNQTSATIP